MELKSISQQIAFTFAYFYGVCFRKRVKLWKENGQWHVKIQE